MAFRPIAIAIFVSLRSNSKVFGCIAVVQYLFEFDKLTTLTVMIPGDNHSSFLAYSFERAGMDFDVS
jgi:hypothetical protein